MEDLTAKIVDVRPMAVADAREGFVPGMAVDFMVGSHGPFTIKFAQKDYTAAAVKAAVNQQAAEIRLTLT